jgi:hypothetical protein
MTGVWFSPTPSERFGETHWDGHLAVLTDFARVHDEKSELVVREGGAPLTRLERVLIGMSFRFTTVDPREDSLPTPTDFIEQLISKVVNEIDGGSSNGFDDALKAAIDFHSFALEAQNTRDEGGLLVNLAQVNDSPFKRPDFEWLREYRRLLRLAGAAHHLFPNLSSQVAFLNRFGLTVLPVQPRGQFSPLPVLLRARRPRRAVCC